MSGMSSAISSGIGAAGSVANGVIGSRSATAASDAQIKAASDAMAQQSDIYNKNSANYNPYIQGGARAEEMLQNGLGQNGALGRQFSLNDFHQDPGYAYALSQGLNAVNNQGSVHGGSLSGGTLKAMNQEAQGQANQQYQSAYNRFVQNQQQNYGQLSGTANAGLQGAESLGNLGQNYANSQSALHVGQGNAAAAGIMGKSLADQGAVNGLAKSGQQYLGSIGS